jgi:SWI/SNF-related matrix-associated actin-dependent regulator 1 of chromatin subfamily A
MKLHEKNGIFWFECSFFKKDIPKSAGFLWHGKAGYCLGICQACQAGIGKVWWTPNLDAAANLRCYGDERVQKLFDGLESAAKESRAADVEDVAEFKEQVPSPDGLEYLPYQRAGIRYTLQRDSTLIGDEMGLGKTIQGIGVVNALPDTRRVLVLCPASLRLNWQREAEKWLVKNWHVQVIEQRHGALKNSAKRLMVVVNYDRLGGKRGAALHAALSQITWDVIIGDEIHYCKNATAQRTKAVFGTWKRAALDTKGLIHSAKKLLFLTGTPITNRPVELFPILRALDPQGLGANFFHFAKRFCDAKRGFDGYWDFKGASNLDEMQEILRRRVMVRRLKKEVLKELPPKRRQVMEFAPNGAASAIKAEHDKYRQYEQQIQELKEAAETAKAIEDEEAFRELMHKLREAQQIAFEEMARERQRVACLKIPHVIEHVNAFLEQSESKLLVFAHHKAVVKGIEEGLEAAGTKYVTVTGDTPMRRRQENVDTFQNDPEVRVFIGNIQAAGVGLTLTAADTVVFAELDWVPANMLQAEDRTHRIGQTVSVLIQYLVFAGSLDAKMAKTLASKMKVIEDALDTEHEPRVFEQEEDEPVETKPRKPNYPNVSDDVRAAAALAVQQLAGVCDGARARDGQGFNALDTRFGKELAGRSMARELTNGEVFAVRKMTRKYRGQLTEDLCTTLWVLDEELGEIDGI